MAATMTTAVPAAKLPKLPTAELIAQYELAMASRDRYFATERSACGGHSRQQRRINRIVDMLSDRADNDDAMATAWLKS